MYIPGNLIMRPAAAACIALGTLLIGREDWAYATKQPWRNALVDWSV